MKFTSCELDGVTVEVSTPLDFNEYLASLEDPDARQDVVNFIDRQIDYDDFTHYYGISITRVIHASDSVRRGQELLVRDLNAVLLKVSEAIEKGWPPALWQRLTDHGDNLFTVHPTGVVELKKPTHKDAARCGHCGRVWDDGVSTDWTPTHGPRCPFEYEHETEEAP